MKTAQQLSMFEPPDVICFPSPIRPPPTTLQYNPPLEISSLSIRDPGTLIFHYLLTAPTHLYILTQTKLWGCSWRWYASSRGSIVAAHCGNHIYMNADPTLVNFMCAQYKMRSVQSCLMSPNHVHWPGG